MPVKIASVSRWTSSVMGSLLMYRIVGRSRLHPFYNLDKPWRSAPNPQFWGCRTDGAIVPNLRNLNRTSRRPHDRFLPSFAKMKSIDYRSTGTFVIAPTLQLQPNPHRSQPLTDWRNPIAISNKTQFKSHLKSSPRHPIAKVESESPW